MIALLMAAHFVADFLLQSREMGRKKSSELPWLLKHLSIQFAVIFLVLSPFSLVNALWFAIANTIIHGIIDWNIWRFYKLSAYARIKKNPQHPLLTGNQDEQWKYWDDHWFYTTIGFDQLLHMLTIVFLAWVYL